VNEKNKVFVIAEAGVNHNGDIEIAYKLIDEAKKAGADAVKFQTFVSEKGISKLATQAEYQKENTGKIESQLDMVKKLELPLEDFGKLKKYCESSGIVFLSTPFEFDSLSYLESIGVERYKISSGEITNMPFLEKVNSLKKEVILSTGMANLEEVRQALELLKDCRKINLLHCNTEYPTPMTDVNLLAMNTLRKEFGLDVGYSDHTLGIEVSVAAVALGASIIEKHFTLDKEMDGPDHKASLEPVELNSMIQAIRNIEKALGNGIKEPSVSEIKNKVIARKSIVAKTEIKKGEKYTEENLTVKRPGNGITPMDWYRLIGAVAKRDYVEDELIEW